MKTTAFARGRGLCSWEWMVFNGFSSIKHGKRGCPLSRMGENESPSIRRMGMRLPALAYLYGVVTQFISNSNVEEWDKSDLEKLLYVIARDNECERLASGLRGNTEKLLALAMAATGSAEHDAKWQLGEELSYLTERLSEAESILLTFALDSEEYVRRRALMALGRIKSAHVVELAKQAWETGDEYQRMAALVALENVHSPNLTTYLDLADQDGRQYLVAHAQGIRRAKPATDN